VPLAGKAAAAPGTFGRRLQRVEQCMFILRFLRFLNGYVRFQAQGVFIERFLNLVARDRIPVWDGHKRDGIYTGCVKASSYRRMRRHAKKTGVRLKVVDKEGAPFHRRKYRRRTGLLVGIALFVVFIYVMSGFIWRIEVNGNETLEDSQVIEALERIGVKTGAWRSSIDVRESERLAMLELDELAWIALNIRGSTIYVEISERTEPPVMVDPHDPCNIVAGQSGQIVSMRVYEGEALLQEGDTVLKGDIIISGITEDRLGQSLYRHALADITARVEPVIRVEVPLHQTQFVETGEQINRRYLQILGLDLPIFLPGDLPKPYRVEQEQNPLTIFGVPFPVSVLREEHILMEEVPVTFTEEQAKSQALEELALLERARMDGAEILEKSVAAILEGDTLYLEARYVCLMEIGVKKEIFHSD